MLATLLDKLNKEFPTYRLSCVKNLLLLTLGILDNKTVCLYQIKGKIGRYLGNDRSKPYAHYKRLLRIFELYALSGLYMDLLRWVFKRLHLKTKYLILDGTSWQHGQQWHHYMTLCVVYGGVAIPIYWVDLAKKGNSSTQERQDLIAGALRHFDLRDKILLADREYVGAGWFKFLAAQGFHFVIRVREGDYKEALWEKGKSLAALQQKVGRSKKANKAIKQRIELAGCPLNWVALKNPNPTSPEPLLYFVSNLEAPASQIAAHYPLRWQIEICFKHLKSNGFQLESMRLQGKARQQLMMAVVVFAYVISILEGLKTYKQVPQKEFANGTVYKQESLFRHGIDSIVAWCGNLLSFCKYLVCNLTHQKERYKRGKPIFVQ